MSAPSPSSTPRRGRRAGSLALVGGVLSVIGTSWIWAISTTPLGGPNWLRAGGSFLLPIGVIVAIVAGVIGLRAGARSRAAAISGLVAAGFAIVGFIALIALYS